MICPYDVAADHLGLGSVLLLAIPAWYVARYALLSARLSGKRDIMGQGLDAIADQTMTDLERLRDSWGMGKVLALIAGTVAAALSYIASLVGTIAC